MKEVMEVNREDSAEGNKEGLPLVKVLVAWWIWAFPVPSGLSERG